jgi:hypothetical protein
MATTRYKIAEQVMLLINGGRVGNASKVHINEIKIAVNQVANQALRMEYFQVNVPMQEMIPNGAAVATYENVLVEAYKNVSKSVLPCYPLKLPRGMGVFQIFQPADVNAQFIPLESSMAALISSQPVLNELLGYTGYEVYGTDVVYTRDLTTPPTPVYVTMRLVVLDIDQYSDYDILPVAPEQEWQIIAEVARMYGAEPPADKLVDPGVKEQRGPIREQIQK